MERRVPRPLRDIAAAPAEPAFRFWIDEVLWSQGRVAVELVEQVLAEAGGLRTGGPGRSEARALRRQLQGSGPLGSQHMGAWELLWTKSTYVIPAARTMRPGQLVSAIIGLNSLTMKKRLMLTLREAYGPEGAFQVTPRTFALPEELGDWETWVAETTRGPPGTPPTGGPSASHGAGRGAGGGDGSDDGRNDGVDSGQGDGGASAEALWILKTGQDAGKGLSLLPASEAIRYAREQLQRRHKQLSPDQPGGPDGTDNRGDRAAAGPNGHGTHGDDAGGGGSDGGSGKRYFPLQVAQLYVADPFLILNRKFHLRLWVLVTCQRPLRAYLHRRGLVLFSAEQYDRAAWASAVAGAAARPSPSMAVAGSAATAPSGAAPAACSMTAPSTKPDSSSTGGGLATSHDLPPSHITNYARNANTLVWSMSQLASHLGTSTFSELWAKLCRACGRAVAAARTSLERAHDWLQPAVPEYGFQMMGVDFLLDRSLTPWLLEFNSAPSIMVQHEVEETRQLVYEQKYGMLRDTWAMVRWRVHRGEEGSGRRGGAPERVPGAREAAAAKATEYVPLMAYMPS